MFLFANNAATTLATGISSTSTTLTLQAGSGALFPNPTNGNQFTVTMIDAITETKTEIMYCTARSGDTLTVTRAQEGTTAQSWVAGDYVRNGPTAGTLALLQSLEQLSVPPVGSASNLSCSLSVASSSATFAATQAEVATSVVNTASGWLLTNYSETVNISTVGAGGLDTGTITNGYVAIYAIGTNPISGTVSILATDVTNSVAPEVYSGSYMPSGYTYSALLSVWRVSGGQLVPGTQVGRSIYPYAYNVLTTATSGALSLSGAVPQNAKTVNGMATLVPTSSSTLQSMTVSICANSNYATVGYIGLQAIGGVSASSYSVQGNFTVPIMAVQTIYVQFTGAATASILITGYTI